MQQIQKFINKEDALTYYSLLKDNISWKVWPFSPNSRTVYHFQIGENKIVDDILLNLKSQIEKHFSINIIGIFCNYYKDGNNFCPYHKDSYGTNVYTLTLCEEGGEREILIKSDIKGSKATSYKIENGDLYVLTESLNSTHKHSIPKRKNITKGRISIVFFGK